MKILTRKQAIEQGLAVDGGIAPIAYRPGPGLGPRIPVMTEREEELIEALRHMVWAFDETRRYLPPDEQLDARDRGAIARSEAAKLLLEKYDAQDNV